VHKKNQSVIAFSTRVPYAYVIPEGKIRWHINLRGLWFTGTSALPGCYQATIPS